MANTNFLENILNTPCIIEGNSDKPPRRRAGGGSPPNRPPGGVGKFLLGVGLGGIGGYSLHDKIKGAVDDPDEALRSLRDKLVSLNDAQHEV